MLLRTELPHTPLQMPIDVADGVLLVGSCFTSHIGEWLEGAWLRVMVNPWGILFNPASIAQSLQRCLADGREEFLLYAREGQWVSFDHHGSLSAPSPEQLTARLTDVDRQARTFLSDARHVIVTWGTAWVFERQGHIVANCQKAPPSEFVRRRLTVDEIVAQWQPIIQSTGLHFIFTVSPIRHLADGLHGNQLSKATLLLAIERLQALFPRQVEYLPVYELLLDDLRDYRFYADDLVHPAPLAITAVRELFSDCAFTPRLRSYMLEAADIARTLNHRPSHPESPEHQALLARTLQRKQKLTECLRNSGVKE